MDKKASQFIGFIVIVFLFVGGLGLFMSHVNNAPSKLDTFAKALTGEGAHFYGAFWCPHCQAEKALFGTSKQYLPYVECSNADKSQTQICIDKKIESFPTWMFKNGVTLTSSSDPVVCKPATKPADLAGEQSLCTQMSSQYFTVYKFPEYNFSVRTTTAPIHKGSTWQFPPEASTAGEIPLDFLAEQIGFVLPK